MINYGNFQEFHSNNADWEEFTSKLKADKLLNQFFDSGESINHVYVKPVKAENYKQPH